MKQLVTNYSFAKGAANVGTVTFTDFSAISLPRILLITDVTSGVILYQFNNPATLGTVATNVLTLSKDTSALANTDKLQIYYEGLPGDPIYTPAFVVGNVSSGSTDSGAPVKIGGVFHSSTITLTDGQRGDMQLDNGGRVITSSGTLAAGEDIGLNVLGIQTKPVVSAVYATTNYAMSGSVDALTKGNMKITAGNVFACRAVNRNSTAARYFMLFNSASSPADGVTALDWWQIPSGTALQPGSISATTDYFAPSEYFANGIAWAISSTPKTLTSTGVTASEHDVFGRIA